MALPRLIERRHATATYYKMREAVKPEGTDVTRWGRHSDHAALIRMVRCEWMERRRTGPRGGIRYHLTAEGQRVYEAATVELRTPPKPNSADVRKHYRVQYCDVRITHDGRVTFRHAGAISWSDGRHVGEYRFIDGGIELV